MAVVQLPPTPAGDPLSEAIRLRPVQRKGVNERFSASDPSPRLELTSHPAIARLVRQRWLQFFMILPNQIIFWAVIFIGLFGVADAGLNFATAITWFLWFCLIFVLMVGIGRAWCAICPFGGFGEWLQRRTLWRRTQKTLGLGLTFPPSWARFGFLISAGTFLGLTYFEEFFNIAGPGDPWYTSTMVLGIVFSAAATFLIFERRTFCRYVCPLTSLIGSVGSMGAVAGFRTKDREVCMSCQTKDCMRGGTEGFGCPWYTWPGSADSNLYCGLCSECYKACPQDNVGLYLQPPLTSVIAPQRRRIDIAWVVVALLGLVLYQQLNATALFGRFDDWLNAHLNFPNYPNPVDYVGTISALILATAGIAWGMSRLFGKRSTANVSAQPSSRFSAFFAPIAYGLIPLVGADYLARQLPKFFNHVLSIIPAIGQTFGISGANSPLADMPILTDSQIVIAQVFVIALGVFASLYATWRIASRDLIPIGRWPLGLRLATLSFVLACGVGSSVLYVLVHAAE